MNRNEILECLKKYNFDPKQYLIISGAAMVLLGIKEKTSDIDISVTQEYYNYLLENYNCTFEKINKYNRKVYFIDNIINFGTDYYKKEIVFVEEFPVQAPKDILELKLSLNREKDIKDIKLIREFINE